MWVRYTMKEGGKYRTKIQFSANKKPSEPNCQLCQIYEMQKAILPVLMVIFTLAAIIIILQPNDISTLQFVKKDSLPNHCGKGDAVEISGKKYACVSFLWKEVEQKVRIPNKPLI